MHDWKLSWALKMVKTFRKYTGSLRSRGTMNHCDTHTHTHTHIHTHIVSPKEKRHN